MALGRAEQRGSPQSWLNEGLILVKLPPEHRPGVLNYRQMSCFPHLTITGFSFQLQEKGGNSSKREKEKNSEEQGNLQKGMKTKQGSGKVAVEGGDSR